MHILICDDDAAFGARMAEYVTVPRNRRWNRYCL